MTLSAAAAAATLLLATTAQAAPTWRINHVPVEGTGPAAAEKILGWGHVQISGEPVGYENCAVALLGRLWNPEAGAERKNSEPPIAGYGPAGEINGLAFSGCEQEQPTGGCRGHFKIQGYDGTVERHDAVYLEPSPWGVVIAFPFGLTPRCDGTIGGESAWELELRGGYLGPAGDWENGTAMGSAPSHWRFSSAAIESKQPTNPGREAGILAYNPPNAAASLEWSFELKIFGLDGSEMVTLK